MFQRNSFLSPVLILWIISLVLSACGGGSAPTGGDGATAASQQKTLVGISISSSNPVLVTDTETKFIVIAIYDDDTSEEVTANVSWGVDNTQIASISPEGILTTQNIIADIVVTARYQGKSYEVSLPVHHAPGATLEVVNFGGVVDETQLELKNYTVEGRYSDGSIDQNLSVTVQDNGTGQLKLLIEETPYEATLVNGELMLSALAVSSETATPNQVVLTALEIENAQDLKRGETLNLSVFGVYSDDSRQNLTNRVQWHSASVAVAQIDANSATGTVIAGNTTGTTEITASYLGLTAKVTISLLPVPEVNIAGPVSGPITIRVNETRTLTATDNAGNDISAVVTWDSSDRSIVNVNASGRISAGSKIGTATISATLDGVSKSVSVAFLAPDNMTLDTAVDNLTINDTLNLRVTASYKEGYSVDVSSDITWVSANPAIASVNANTLQTYSVVDSTTITGNAYGKTLQENVTVINNNTSLSLQSIAFDEASIAMLSGDTVTPIIRAIYNDGSQVYVSSNIDWLSADTSVATVSTSGLITAMNKSGQATITATFEGQSADITINVSQPAASDYVTYQITGSQTQSRIETTDVSVKSFFNPSGLLLDMPIVPASGTPFPAQFITMSNGQEQIAFALSADAGGSYDKTNSLISFVPDVNSPIYYALDNTNNTSISFSAFSVNDNGKSTATFDAVLCQNTAIANDNCNAFNSIEISGEFSATIENDKAFNCYAADAAKIIDDYTLHSYQEICADELSYYQLNTIPGLAYKVDVKSIDALVDVTMEDASNSAITSLKSTATGDDIQTLTFTALSDTTRLIFNNNDTGTTTGTIFKLDINVLTASPQGSVDAPFMFDNSLGVTGNAFSVDDTVSYYKFPVSQGYSYRISFITKSIQGNPLKIEATSSTSGFSALEPCIDTICNIYNAESDFIYAKIIGPVSGYAVGTIYLKYKTDRDRNNYDEALTLPLPVTAVKGQVGDRDSAGDGTINNLQGSLYWVDGLDASKNYIVKVSGVDKFTQLWVNLPRYGGVGSSCEAGGDEKTSSFSCFIESRQHYGQMSIGITTVNPNGTKYTIDIVETTDQIYYVSTFANGGTFQSTFEKTGISIYRQGETEPYVRSVTTPSTFNSVPFAVASGETVFIKVTDPYNSGNFYSIIVNRTGSTPFTGVDPGAPDMFEPFDDVRAGATELILDELDRNRSHHSLINEHGGTGDQDWFKFTAP